MPVVRAGNGRRLPNSPRATSSRHQAKLSDTESWSSFNGSSNLAMSANHQTRTSVSKRLLPLGTPALDGAADDLLFAADVAP
jgi:hypothetical protein